MDTKYLIMLSALMLLLSGCYDTYSSGWHGSSVSTPSEPYVAPSAPEGVDCPYNYYFITFVESINSTACVEVNDAATIELIRNSYAQNKVFENNSTYIQYMKFYNRVTCKSVTSKGQMFCLKNRTYCYEIKGTNLCDAYKMG
jgi:hypothetical protein